MPDADELFEPSEQELDWLRRHHRAKSIEVAFVSMAVHSAFVDGHRLGKAVTQGSCLLSIAVGLGVPILVLTHTLPWWTIPLAWTLVWNWQKILGGILRRSLVNIALTNRRAFRHWYESGYLVIYVADQTIKFPRHWNALLKE